MIRWARHVARMGEKCTRFDWESPKERDHLEDRGVDGRIGSE
jgi:branched-subunit amino acid aminotransferase/4-amino-4-deoxychorismate lyase